MKFSYLMFNVRDIDNSLKLYRDILGFEVERRYTEDNGIEAAFVVEKGEIPMQNKAMLELVTVPPGEELRPSGYLIGIQVDQLNEKTALMEAAGYAVTTQKYSPAPGVHIAHFSGPDGEAVGLMQLDLSEA